MPSEQRVHSLFVLYGVMLQRRIPRRHVREYDHSVLAESRGPGIVVLGRHRRSIRDEGAERDGAASTERSGTALYGAGFRLVQKLTTRCRLTIRRDSARV